MEPIPGGFPVAKRHANAGQVRVSASGLAAITADPAALIGSIAGGSNGVLSFNVPASCSGSTPICCPGGTPLQTCGPLDIDLTKHTGDSQRFVIAPQQGESTVNVTIRARLKTEMNIPVKVPVAGDCAVSVDTTAGSVPDVQIDAPISFTQDEMTGTTRVTVGTVNLTNLQSEDVNLTGGFGCAVANVGLDFFMGVLTSQLTGTLQSTIQKQTCKKCPSGDVAECGSPFATACTNNVCQEGTSGCLQELGVDGRLRGSSLFKSLSPTTTGAIDLYEVTGSYATTNSGGIGLGLLGGLEPGGAPRDRCGPMAIEPTIGAIPQSANFEGNGVAPYTGFDVAVGLHKSQLAQLAYAGYDGGLFCLTIGYDTVKQLTTASVGFALSSNSLDKYLVENTSPMEIGLRPQSPPTITLGKNTFTTDGSGNTTLSEPLLDVTFKALELDFFAEVDQQWIRVFTVVTDVHLPVGLQVGMMGELTPVIGTPTDAFTNISVKNSEGVAEPPDQLAMKVPSLVSIVLPLLANGLPAIKLPSIGGLDLDVTAITAVDDEDGDGKPDFLAIFAKLATAMAAEHPVKTTGAITGVHDTAIPSDPQRWRDSPPTVELALGGDAQGLEWSIRIDDTTWSAWSRNPRPVVSSMLFRLPGTHHLDVRARVAGRAATTDGMPVRLAFELGTPATTARTGSTNVHGTVQGCACDSSQRSPGPVLPLAVIVGLVLIGRRRLRRAVGRLGAVVWAIAIACLPGCSCDSHPCGDTACMKGEVRSVVGRWTSIAGDDKRVMVASYDQLLGDLVAVDVTDPMNQRFTAVDGIPSIPPTYDPSTYRGGVADAGPNVGAWTSIAMSDHTARIAYQDRDAGALKYAYEVSAAGKWKSYVVDDGGGIAAPSGNQQTGQYASMIIDPSGNPAIAYISTGNDDGAGHMTTELRLARATKANPGSPSDWAMTTIASAPGTCAGICASGTSCVADATSVQSCVLPTTDCSSACGTGDVCVNGACTTEIEDPMIDDLPTGTGLFVSLVALPDGRLAAAYYDRTRLALVLAVENAAGTSQFTENVLDGNASGLDRGMWSNATVVSDGTVLVAYQDAIGNQLMYTTWNITPGYPEVVDDGERPNDRPHPVGAAAVIYLDNGTPTIAYQDGLTADVYTAAKSGGAWMPTGLATGPVLDGFSIAVTTGHGKPVLAWDTRDPSQFPPNGLTVLAP
jgi:hypothetical protein